MALLLAQLKNVNGKEPSSKSSVPTECLFDPTAIVWLLIQQNECLTLQAYE